MRSQLPRASYRNGLILLDSGSLSASGVGMRFTVSESAPAGLAEWDVNVIRVTTKSLLNMAIRRARSCSPCRPAFRATQVSARTQVGVGYQLGETRSRFCWYGKKYGCYGGYLYRYDGTRSQDQN